jgi:hypothetical protein
MPTYGIINVGTGAQPVWYGSPSDPSPFTIANISASANIWLGSNQSVGPANPNESTVITPGGYLSLDGSQSVYYVVADATNGEVTIYPGVTSYFLPVNLSGLGGASVYQQATAPTGIIAPGSLWINTTTGGIEIYMGGAWNPVQFNAASLLEVQTVVATLIAAGTIVAGIVNGTTITAATFEGTEFVFTTNGCFWYSGTPSAGNLIYSFVPGTANVSDPFGNTARPGLTIGADNAAQFNFVSSGASGTLSIIFNGTVFNNAALSTVSGTFAQVAFTGPSDSAVNHNDSVFWQQNSSDGSGSSNMSFGYNDANGSPHFYETVDWNGVTLPVTKTITATEPGTGTSATNPASGESWHNASFVNGWGASGSASGGRYRLLPIGAGVVEIEAELVNATAVGNSVAFTLPSGYQPTVGHNRPAAWNNPQANNSTTPPWVNVQTNGNVQITGIEVANKGIFFDIFIPLD